MRDCILCFFLNKHIGTKIIDIKVLFDIYSLGIFYPLECSTKHHISLVYFFIYSSDNDIMKHSMTPSFFLFPHIASNL